VLVDLAWIDAAVGDAPRRLDELGPPAVVERDPEADAAVQLGAVLHRLHPRAQRLGCTVATADEAHADALLGEVGQLALDRFTEDLHQRVHLVLRPRPVLGRERVDDDVADAELDSGLDRAPQRPRARAVTGGGRQPAAARPASVPVHDDRDRPG